MNSKRHDMHQHTAARRALMASAAGLLACVSLPAFAGQAWQTAVMPQAKQLDVTSRHTGQRYRIFISVPETQAPAAGHPVLYLLDGNATFPSAALMARTVARRSKATGQNAPLIVGIGYASGDDYDSAARSRDYTPPAGDKTGKGEGGADLFLDFLEQELKPIVLAVAPIDRQRQALFGHSYGGLLTLHALFTRPAAFQAYIAASPSIWYAEQHVLGELKNLAAPRTERPKVLLTVGALEQPAAPPSARESERSAALARRRMVDQARDLAAQLAVNKDGFGLERVRFVELAHENHGSAMFPALARGMEFFLE